MATQKAGEQRALAKQQYNAFFAQCPSRQLLDRISDKWVVLILCALGNNATDSSTDVSTQRVMRYSELSRLIAGVSQKMLTQTLRSLERDGLLTRTVKPTVPVTVAYQLTALGESLHEMTRSVRTWAQSNMDEVQENRDRYDERND